MRIVYFHRGAFQDYLVEFLNAMAGLVEAHLVVAGTCESILPHLSSNIQVYRSHAPAISNPRNLFLLRTIAEYIRQLRPDLVHMQSGNVWELLLKRMLPIPFMMTSHDAIKHSRHSLFDLKETPQFLLDRSLAIADGVVVQSERMHELVLARKGRLVRGKPLYVIPHGVLSHYGTGEASIVPKAANILQFGRLDAYKGVETLIKAEPRIRRVIPNVKVIVAGGCQGDPKSYRRLVGSDQQIELRLWRQNDTEVRDLFGWADVLALPYRDATQSGVLQVGVSFGLPSVVTNVGGLPDVIHDRVNGMVVPPDDEQKLAEAIITLLTNTALRRTVIENIMKDREETYSWRVIAQNMVAAYEDLLAKCPRGWK
jgi:alpha-maltose-1-phosphate synthase